MKKILIMACVCIAFFVSGVSVYSYMNEKNRYAAVTVVPEQRDDLPLYKGLEFQEHNYLMKGNHWYDVYVFYKKQMPLHGWKLVHKQASIEGSGGFITSWEKDHSELFIDGGWNPHENTTEVKFDLRPIIRSTSWIESIPSSICVYASKEAETCSTLSDQKKIEQFVNWVNDEAMDKEDAPLQKDYGIVVVNGKKIEIHYDPELPSFTLKSADGRKQLKPEPLLELLGLTELKTK
ncbi:hypothetical protein AWM68_00695 [Fictibacillus phosphorivorans]|uniref:Uncharacterized protein n=1 Tax=Fictibacillus phosphorivorans TaxID=1221500 RepID=A0A163SDS4_9BACL|nr:hypothetical protein [Fictibacillus phosphorivorans]KZE68828.1 hypothetical protein AWM68_00695 [Fictibacillus phosphorivorans]